MERALLFTITTPLGIIVRTTGDYWEYLVSIKHRIMRDKEELVKEILSCPDEIRQSRIDKGVYLYYKNKDRLYCVVCRHEGNTGYIITAYPTDKVKEGDVIWKT